MHEDDDAARRPDFEAHDLPQELFQVVRYRLDVHGQRIEALEKRLETLNLRVLIERQAAMKEDLAELKAETRLRLGRIERICTTLAVLAAGSVISWMVTALAEGWVG